MHQALKQNLWKGRDSAAGAFLRGVADMLYMIGCIHQALMQHLLSWAGVRR